MSTETLHTDALKAFDEGERQRTARRAAKTPATSVKTAAEVAHEITSPPPEQAATAPSKIVLNEKPGDWAQAGNRLNHADPGETTATIMTTLKLERLVSGEDQIPENASPALRKSIEEERQARKELAEKRANVRAQLNKIDEWNCRCDTLADLRQRLTNATNEFYMVEAEIKTLEDMVSGTFQVGSWHKPRKVIDDIIRAKGARNYLESCVKEAAANVSAYIHSSREYARANDVPEHCWPSE